MTFDFSDATHVYVSMDERNEGVNLSAYNEATFLNKVNLPYESKPFDIISLQKSITDQGSFLVMGSPEEKLEITLKERGLLHLLDDVSD